MIAATFIYRGHVGDLLIVDRGRPFVFAQVVIVGTDLLLVGLLLIVLRGITLDPPRRAPASMTEAHYWENGAPPGVGATVDDQVDALLRGRSRTVP